MVRSQPGPARFLPKLRGRRKSNTLSLAEPGDQGAEYGLARHSVVAALLMTIEGQLEGVDLGVGEFDYSAIGLGGVSHQRLLQEICKMYAASKIYRPTLPPSIAWVPMWVYKAPRYRGP